MRDAGPEREGLGTHGREVLVELALHVSHGLHG